MPPTTIQIRQAELERLVQEQILSGHFQNMSEVPAEALRACARKALPRRLRPVPARTLRNSYWNRPSPAPTWIWSGNTTAPGRLTCD